MLSVLLLLFSFCDAKVQMEINAGTKKMVPLLITGIDQKEQQDIKLLIESMQKNFSFTNQFQVDCKIQDSIPKKSLIKKLSKNYLFTLFITAHTSYFEWRLYDTLSGSMVAGKKYKKRGNNMRGWAHNMSDAIWHALTGQEGFFSTKIAFCKELLDGDKKVKHVYIADYDGSYAEKLVDTPTINVAPRWNNDHKRPLLFYSDFTNTNVRLMVTDLQKHRSVASNFEGVNMIPAFSRDGKKVVYCISRGDGSCQLYYHKKGSFKKITHNSGNNVSPSLSDDGKTVYFCSDYQTGSPQIYRFNLDTNEFQRLTNGGYCASPRYSEKAKKLAYAKIIQGIMQLFIYDIASKEHAQLTHDAGNKEEFSWSPCGTKLLYSSDEPKKGSRIAMLSLISNEKHYLTSAKEQCSFPDWSPIYDYFPVITVS